MASPPTSDRIRAWLFDMDGVLTDTARLHAAAWKTLFDDVLRDDADASGGAFVPFDPRADYERYVDGRPRLEGIRTFLAARGVRAPGDGSEEERVLAMGERKNALLQEKIDTDGVTVYPDAVEALRRLRAAGRPTALVSSSANAERLLAASSTRDLFDAVVSGADLAPRGLRGKPAPDSFVAAAADLGVGPEDAAVVEDAVSGIAAGREGGFGLVVGVNRHAPDHAATLTGAGADVVVQRLTDLDLPTGAPS